MRSGHCALPYADHVFAPSLGIIHDALAADFDGDSKLDLFVMYKIHADQNGFNGGILWGDREKLSEYRFISFAFADRRVHGHTGISNETMILGELRLSLPIEMKTCVSSGCVRRRDYDRVRLESIANEAETRAMANVDLHLDDLQPIGYLFQNIPTTIE